MKVKKDSLNKAAEAKKKAEAKKEQKEITKPVTLNLGWGIWHGKIIDKRPKGFGTINITKPQTIQDSIKVKTGEKIINCEIRNGKVYQGTIIHNNGTKETITP